MAQLSSVHLPYIGDGQFIPSASVIVPKDGVNYERQIAVIGDPNNPDELLNISGGKVPVTATDLDIRNLSSTQDSVTVAGSVTINNLPVVQAVTATDLDIRNLSSVQDSVRSFDSSDTEYLKVATSVTQTGDTVLVTPSVGKRIRLQWVYAINDPVSTISTKITIKLGTEVQYVSWAISKRQQLTGDVNAPLIINLSNLGDVAVTIFYQEV
jgi:hypothetical protein